MPALAPDRETAPVRWGRWFFAGLATVVIVAHGCHGPDEDHEPSAPPARVEAHNR